LNILHGRHSSMIKMLTSSCFESFFVAKVGWNAMFLPSHSPSGGLSKMSENKDKSVLPKGGSF